MDFVHKAKNYSQYGINGIIVLVLMNLKNMVSAFSFTATCGYISVDTGSGNGLLLDDRNQCWSITSEVMWHSPEGNFTGNARHTYRMTRGLENVHNINVTAVSSMGQWVNNTLFFSSGGTWVSVMRGTSPTTAVTTLSMVSTTAT